MKKFVIFLSVFVAGCAGVESNRFSDSDFVYAPIQTDGYLIASWQKITNPFNNHIHIYIEGDGNAFDYYGNPTRNPTPRGTFVRDLAMNDDFDNVAYIARPCQYILNKNCDITDWTDGRFSQKIIDSMTDAVELVAKNKHITLIGYSGGAMVSGLIILQNPQMKIDEWITIAGVLNHKKWTRYFGDEPLNKSLDMDKLPNVPQTHFIGVRDETIPYELARTWANEGDIRFINNATHDNFGDLKIFD